MEIIVCECNLEVQYLDTNKPDQRLFIIEKYLASKNFKIVHNNEELSDSEIEKIHDTKYIKFLKNAFESAKQYNDKDWFNGTFLIPNHFFNGLNPKSIDRLPLYKLSGYYSKDYMSPIGQYTHNNAAKSAMNSYIAANKLYSNPTTIYYALNSSPGHHASTNAYAGYCFYNNAAIAANRLLELGAKRVAILNCDYHNSDGTEKIFYNRSDVLTISLHCDPTLDYPSYTGWEDEVGEGKGLGYHYNFPLQKSTTWYEYEVKLDYAINIIKEKNCDYLIIEFGADTLCTDPNPANIAGFNLQIEDYKQMGKKFSQINIPKMITQEGGYDLDNIPKVIYNLLSNII